MYARVRVLLSLGKQVNVIYHNRMREGGLLQLLNRETRIKSDRPLKSAFSSLTNFMGFGVTSSAVSFYSTIFDWRQMISTCLHCVFDGFWIVFMATNYGPEQIGNTSKKCMGNGRLAPPHMAVNDWPCSDHGQLV